MTFSNNVPNIRIGVIQSADQVDVQCNQTFSLKNSKGEILYLGSANQKLAFKITSSQPAEIRYQLRAGIEKREADAKKFAQNLKHQGLEAHIRTVGMSFEINKHLANNREYWITVGEFSTSEEALEFRNQQAEPGEYVVIEKILKPATGEIELAGQKLGDVVRIVPDNP
ncbi:MAG TPA: SPOR domain-containing protein, partial [bacterium]